jgi:two-component system, LuxR family, response regulator DctR
MNNDALVLICDDESAVRDALAWLLRSRGLESRGFASGEELLAHLEKHPVDQPVCIVLDVRLGQTSGVEVFSSLRKREEHALAPVIFLTGHGDIPMAVEAVKQGAFDFFEKPFNDNALVDRVISALSSSRANLQQHRASTQVRQRLATLSERERQVMELVLAGKLNKQIADELDIAMRTVEVHRASVFDKMGVRSAVDLAQLLASVPYGGARG